MELYGQSGGEDNRAVKADLPRLLFPIFTVVVISPPLLPYDPIFGLSTDPRIDHFTAVRLSPTIISYTLSELAILVGRMPHGS